MKEINWRFIDTGKQDAATNMAIDEAILMAHSEGLVPPTIRFYTWQPASVSIGYFQKLHKEIDLDQIKSYNLGLVRRMTGGRAVLHDDELTYSVMISEKHMPTSVIEAYRLIGEALLHGFKALGLEASFAIPDQAAQPRHIKQNRSAVCFDASSWYELIVEGRKVAGSAQTRQKGVVLQHGSIPLSFNLDMLFDVCRFPSDKVKQRMKEGFKDKAVAINALRTQPVTIQGLQDAFYTGFEHTLQQSLRKEDLTLYERELSRHLILNKYTQEEWNHRR
ncbi:lipoate--protein ligase family protein [Caldalkalibacillus salinus]|uniref:lipoate--protein ligase family protein n=1 Tax=Caldalkalibacillus salinus TaxID=2803787 RepID=UPI0019221DB5|nr:biotin/lipoate A/B protein ligase family protein [Caldalkalibacillus salinus]